MMNSLGTTNSHTESRPLCCPCARLEKTTYGIVGFQSASRDFRPNRQLPMSLWLCALLLREVNFLTRAKNLYPASILNHNLLPLFTFTMGMNHSHPIPSMSVFLERHWPPFPNLGEGTSAVPSHSEPIQIQRKEKRFLVSSELLAITNIDGSPYAGGITIQGHLFSVKDCIMLEDASGRPIAVITHDPWNAGFIICGTYPLRDGQPKSDRFQIHGKPLYPWAKVMPREREGIQIYILMMRTPDEDFSLVHFKAIPVGPVVGPQSRVIQYRGKEVGFIRSQKEEQAQSEQHTTVMILAPGIDPCLMLCFSAIILEYQQGVTHSSPVG